MADENITLRELMEAMRAEFRESIQENASLRGAVKELTDAIRGSGADKGLVRHMDAIQESQRIIKEDIDQFRLSGTPKSQMELRSLNEKDLRQDVAIAEVKGRLDKLEERGDARRWQIVVLFVGSCIAILTALGSWAAQLLMHMEHLK